jgi:hypothetical protein
MNISVTEQDIKAGKPFDATGCPISLAVSRAMGCIAETRGFEITLHNGSTSIQVDVPASIRDRIYQFDTHGVMTPFSFEIREVEGPVLKMEYAEVAVA